MEVRILVREYIRFHVAVIESLEDVFFEMGCTRVRLHDRSTVRICEAAVIDSQDIHFDACCQESNDRMHVLRDARSGVKGNRCPHVVEALFRNVIAVEQKRAMVRQFESAQLLRNRAGVGALS